MTQVSTREVKSILTAQKGGFLASPPYPFTHSLSPYTGCGFGKTACGKYCYAQFMPNWTNFADQAEWGDAISVKSNAADVLRETLEKMKPEKRGVQRTSMRIFMASTTDPYQPLEAKYGITRACLDVFADFSDLDLLIIQTRSPLAARDFEIIKRIPYAWLSMSIETDDQSIVSRLGGGTPIRKRLEVVRAAVDAGLKTQIVVSPCLPYTPDFADTLLKTGAQRIVVDDFVAGDGSKGARTAASPFAAISGYDWRDNSHAQALHDTLKAAGADVSYSATGFCGIPPRVVQKAVQAALPL